MVAHTARMFLAGGALMIAAAVPGCSDPGPSASDTTAIATDSASNESPILTPSKAVARFGRYRVDPTPELVRPTATSDGEFTVMGSSPAGHRVGRVAGRLAIWPADAAAPSYMFRPDTALGTLWQAAISDRLEVVFSVGSAVVDSIFSWRGNQLKRVIGRNCRQVTAVGSRGLIGINSTCLMYNSGSTAWSPHDPDSTRSGRFAGGASCQFGGRYSSIIAIDDENDVLKSGEIAIFNSGYKVDGGAGTCMTLPALPVEDGGYGDYWVSIRAGLIGGTHGTSGGPNNGLLSDGAHLAFVNDLLTAAVAKEWKIIQVLRIDPGKALICQGVSLIDGRKATIKLVPAG